MKNILFAITSILIIFFGCEKIEVDDEVIIPDKELLRHLLSQGIDTDKDYKISHAEAEIVTYLDISGSPPFYHGIKSLKGIEAFSNLDTLICNYGLIEDMDISKNTALTYLDCWSNSLSSLDVSKNTALTYLDCWRNPITSLDVSKNTALTHFFCGENALTSLDVSKNTALTVLWCGENLFTSLDISKNTALKEIVFWETTTLSKVCVWTLPFPSGVVVYNYYSPNVYFTTDCSNN